MDYNVGSVPLRQIDTTDQTFRITTNHEYSDLVPSIKSIGLLHPPLLFPKERTYGIVCGFRRIAACQSLDIGGIPARIGRNASPCIDYVRLAVADNSSQRELNIVEQARAFALVKRFTKNALDWRDIAQSVGLPASQSAMDRLLPIVDMPDTLQMAVVNGSIALPVALSINQLQNGDAEVVSHLFQKIHTGLNIQRELLELLDELAIIKEMPIACLLKEQCLASILTDVDAPPPQKVQCLRQVLRKMRYPELSKAEDAFRFAFKALKVSSAIQVQPPRFFEGSTFRFTLSVNNRQQLKALLPDIEKIADSPRILPE